MVGSTYTSCIGLSRAYAEHGRGGNSLDLNDGDSQVWRGLLCLSIIMITRVVIVFLNTLLALDLSTYEQVLLMCEYQPQPMLLKN